MKTKDEIVKAAMDNIRDIDRLKRSTREEAIWLVEMLSSQVCALKFALDTDTPPELVAKCAELRIG